MKNLILTITALFFTLSVSAQTVVDAAVSNKDFSTLVTALKAADLVGALSGEGPFTVFAPNNDAFSKIDAATLGSLLKPENVKALSNILTYHVVSGKLMASDVLNALESGNGVVELTALNGQAITAISKDGKIYLEDSQGNMSEIIATDVTGSNGVIHVISSVVMPR
ncbi:MAG: beta-Ig-H3/fasciclin [Flammeovirgaceae bacterium]|nr:beta-Ig-H3/fasciclin [Flammeovirgaceae bacterium]